MYNWLELLLLMLIAGMLSLKFLALWSQRRSRAYGLIEGKLAPRPHSPNGCCSEGQGANCAALPVHDENAWKRLQELICSEGGRIIKVEGYYLHAVFRTPLLGFEDDLECRYEPSIPCIHIRSASRVGHSDLGVNQKRVENLRAHME